MKDKTLLGIIGGSGLDRVEALVIEGSETVSTPYGEPSAALTRGRLGSLPILFLPRHGSDHSIAPHRINYRANLWALHAAGVRDVVAVATVGGIHERMPAGSLVLPDQIIDYTWGRESTYFDGLSQPLQHIDFTQPFSAALRGRLRRAAVRAGAPLTEGGTYGATQGPRLETAAEIGRMARDGADLVGMTGMPEAALARELGLEYAMLAVVVNAAAGRGDNREAISLEQIHQTSARVMQDVLRVLTAMGEGG